MIRRTEMIHFTVGARRNAGTDEANRATLDGPGHVILGAGRTHEVVCVAIHDGCATSEVDVGCERWECVCGHSWHRTPTPPG